MVELAVCALRCCPGFPAVFAIEDVGVLATFQGCLGTSVLLQFVEIFEQKKPGCLLRVIEFDRAAALFPKDIVNISESLFKHELSICPVDCRPHQLSAPAVTDKASPCLLLYWQVSSD